MRKFKVLVEVEAKAESEEDLRKYWGLWADVKLEGLPIHSCTEVQNAEVQEDIPQYPYWKLGD